MNFYTIFAIALFIAAGFGALLIVAHVLFLCALHRAHPDLWRDYWRVRESVLRPRVISQINDPVTLFLHRLQALFGRLLSVFSIVGAIGTLLTHV